MSDIPAGLIDGRAPLLTALMRQRARLRHRIQYLAVALTQGVCAPAVVAEYNALAAILSGRAA